MKTEEYIRGGGTLLNMLDVVRDCLNSEQRNILDLAGYKSPKAIQKLAGWYPSSQFDHFREDNIRLSKISPEVANINNLDVVTSYRKLKPSYDFILAFFTLHELRRPERSLKKLLRKVDGDGTFCCVDYDLSWFLDLAKERDFGQLEIRENFSKYLFVENNECAVLGMKNGEGLLREGRDGDVIEANCVKNHTFFGMKEYLGIFNRLGLRELELISYEVDTPWGLKPKQFLYLGKKV